MHINDAFDFLANNTYPGPTRLRALDSLAAFMKKAEADAKTLADVRTLDEWQGSYVGRNPRVSWTLWCTFTGHCTCELRSDAFEVDEHFSGATPDEARAKAAAWVREQEKGAPRYRKEGDFLVARGPRR